MNGQLLINRCGDCGTWHQPPHHICPKCLSENIVPTPVSGKGTVYLLTFLYLGSPEAGVDFSTGHPAAAIELIEQLGLRIGATITDCPKTEMKVGMQVEATFIERNGEPVLAFRPAK